MVLDKLVEMISGFLKATREDLDEVLSTVAAVVAMIFAMLPLATA